MNFRKTILIVCEGTRSEPDYFQNIRDIVYAKCDNEVFLKILPLPSQEIIQKEAESKQPLRRGARPRKLKDVALGDVEDYIIEEEYRSQPLSYVRKAQLGYKEHGYDELWAVYDLDGHTHHKEAYELSINSSLCDKIVNIAFSAISFELWILLHFELVDNAYSKSMCRDKKEMFYCGDNRHAEDCNGSKCACGRIVSQKYLKYDKRKKFNFEDYFKNNSTAIENALKLRGQNKNNIKEFYNLNPYVSIDKLVFKLLNLPNFDLEWQYEWPVNIDNVTYDYTIFENNIMLHLTNQSDRTQIINTEQIIFLDVEGKAQHLLKNNIRIDINETKSFPLAINKLLKIGYRYIAFKVRGSNLKVSELNLLH